MSDVPHDGGFCPDRLTPHQLRVLTLMAQGHTDLAVGRALHITRNTVKNHKRMIFHHLNVHNACHAVAVALTLGLIKLPNLPVTDE